MTLQRLPFSCGVHGRATIPSLRRIDIMQRIIQPIARRLFILAGVMTAVSLLGISANHFAHASGTPAVQITPSSGKWGTLTVVTGQNFAADEQVAIYKETRAFFAWETNSSGSFVGKPEAFNGPGPLSNVFTITAIGRTSGLKATTTFTVTN
jgi:hypothetical protein